MLIEELKQALREVRDMCGRIQRCSDCPLEGEEGCPVRNDDGTAFLYPSEWRLVWDESDEICPHCGKKMTW